MFLHRVERVLLFLVLLFLPTQLGRHFWPSFAYIYSLKIDYLSPTLYFWDILVLGLLLVWLSRKPAINKAAFNLFLFFLFTQAVSLVTSTNLGAGLVRLEQYLLAGMWGLYLASQNFSALKERLAYSLILSIVFSATLGLWQFLSGKTLGLWFLGERSFTISTPGIAKFNFYSQEFLRPYATFPHPNVLAAYLLIISLLLNLIESSKNKAKKILVNFLSGLVVLMTVSRVVILIGLGVLLMVLNKKWKIIILVIFLLLLPILSTRYLALLSFDNLTLIRREELAQDALRVIAAHPMLGIGLNNLIPYSSTHLISGPSRFLQPVHNIYLLALAESGVVGLVGWILLLAYPIYKTHQSKKLFLIWLTILFLGLFDHYFFTLPQGYRILFLLWGVSLSLAAVSNNEVK